MTLSPPTDPQASGPPPPAPERNDVRSWIAATRRALQAISDEAPLEAELLVRHVAGLDRAALYASPERKLTTAQARSLLGLTARRLRREPLPYILGDWEFRGLSFRVTPAVMVPRPETETLVEEALAWRERRPDEGSLTVVDVGTGSGCIAVSLAARLPNDKVIAVDVSTDALAVAAENAGRHGVGGRVRLLESDLLSDVTEQVDLIVANLPYIPDAEVPSLQPEVRDYEPPIALGGGPDGLALIRRLLRQARARLSRHGTVMLEINPPQSATLPDEVRAMFPGADVRVVQDLAGLDRVVVIDFLRQAPA